MKKHSLFFIFSLFLAGCATEQGYRLKVQSWIGQPEIELIKSWGVPQNVYETDGVKFIVFQHSSLSQMPGVAPSYFARTIGNTTYVTPYGGAPSYIVVRDCQTSFGIEKGIVVSYSFKGSDCKASEKDTALDSPEPKAH